MPPKKSGGAKGATKGKGEDESKGASKEKKGGTAVKVIIHIIWRRTSCLYMFIAIHVMHVLLSSPTYKLKC